MVVKDDMNLKDWLEWTGSQRHSSSSAVISVVAIMISISSWIFQFMPGIGSIRLFSKDFWYMIFLAAVLIVGVGLIYAIIRPETKIAKEYNELTKDILSGKIKNRECIHYEVCKIEGIIYESPKPKELKGISKK
jgi:hypothetical protein